MEAEFLTWIGRQEIKIFALEIKAGVTSSLMVEEQRRIDPGNLNQLCLQTGKDWGKGGGRTLGGTLGQSLAFSKMGGEEEE